MSEVAVGSRNSLPVALWLFAPVVLLGGIYLARYVDLPFYLRWIEGEQGLVENLTPLLLGFAVVSGLLLIRHRSVLPGAPVLGWFLVHALGCFYFAGEELSWGQHFFGWGTPEQISALNDQNETNLHNMSSWLDQKPRLLLVLWAIGGGVIGPILIYAGKLKVGGPDGWRYWIFPPVACLPAALVVMLVRAPEDISFALGTVPPFPFDVRASEVQELYLALFLSFYVISVYRRAVAQTRQNTRV